MDCIHVGDLDGVKGVYHINVVDEVTQWQHVGTVAAISERFLIPVLEALIEALDRIAYAISDLAAAAALNRARRDLFLLIGRENTAA